MLKVLIIDDEKNVRETLKILIDWERLDFSICGEAVNGNQGLEMCRSLKPDLVITDIRMPGIDGLEMIKLLKNSHLNVKIIIITGYSYFKYAKQALDYKVDGFLLKPIDEEELENRLFVIKAEIEKQRIEQELLEKSRKLAAERLLVACIKEENADSLQLENWFRVNALPWKYYQLLLFAADKPVSLNQHQKDEIRNAIEAENLMQSHGFIFELDGSIACLLEEKIDTGSLQVIKQITACINEIPGMVITVYIGRSVKKFNELGLVYQKINEVMDKNFFYRKNEIIFTSRLFNKAADGDSNSDFFINDFIEQLFMAMDLNEEKEIESILEKIKQAFIEKKPPEDTVKSAYIALYHTIIKRITDKRADMNYLLEDYEKMVLIIGRFERIYDLDQLLKEKLLHISFELCATRPRKNVIERAIEYIDRHYDINIKLKLLAEMFHYNTAYFGQFFRKTTGDRFNTYLDKVRIRKAKFFLNDGHKVYKVAEMTGFSDVDNFHKKFRKYTGMSPSEFKKKGNNDAHDG